MPKRTNEYQRLILAINNHFASQSAKVVESAMLYDPTSEQDREIDILIEDKVGGYTMKVGIECTETKRPLTVAKLVELVDKHQCVGINKTVIVAKSGFAGSTTIKAEKLGVDLISYEAALEKDWPKEFQILSCVKPFHMSCELSVDLPLTIEKGSSLDGLQPREDYLVLEHNCTLSDLLFGLLKIETGGTMLPPYLNPEQTGKKPISFTKSWFFEPAITLKSKKGKVVRVMSAHPTYLYSRVPLFGKFKGGTYNGHIVASSTTKTDGIFKQSRLTISQDSSTKGLSISLSLDTKQ